MFRFLLAPTRTLPLPATRVARVRQHNLLIKTLMEDSRFVAPPTLRHDKRHLALFYTFTFIIHPDLVVGFMRGFWLTM